MAEIGISEFTFGYAFLFEQTQASWAGLIAAPVLPSLKQEEEQGWDAHLPVHGTDFYYQFKLSEYLSRANATYIQNGTYGGPYYRFWLHRRNNNQQHHRLKLHCVDNPHTYYVAPQFNSIEQFNTQFLAHEVTANCRIIPLTDFDDITDGAHHCVTFQAGNETWIAHSEPRRHERSFTGDQIGALYKESSQRWQKIGLDFTRHLFEKTRETARKIIAEEEFWRVDVPRPLLDEPTAGANQKDLLLRTADILSATMGLTLVLVGSPK